MSYAFAAGEPDDVGRILGALYPFLISHGHLGEVPEWVEAALADRERLSDRGLAETLVGGGEIARFAGDLDRAIELKEELRVRDEGELRRPNWRAATLADLCEIALDQGDFARRACTRSRARRPAAGRGPICASRSSRSVPAISTGGVEGPRRARRPRGGDRSTTRARWSCSARPPAARATARSRTTASADGLGEFADIGDGGGIADCLDGLARLAVAAETPIARAAFTAPPSGCARRAAGDRSARDAPFPDVPDAARGGAR